MKDKIINMINSVGVFDTAKYFGGIQALKTLTKDSQELSKIIDKETKGKWILGFSFGFEGFYRFNFEIMDFVIDDEIFLTLIVNLKLNFKNLTNREIEDLKIYLIASALDIDGDIEVNSTDLDKYTHKMIYIKNINGELVSDSLHGRAEEGGIISHNEALELIKKISKNTGEVTENIRHKIKKVLRSI